MPNKVGETAASNNQLITGDDDHPDKYLFNLYNNLYLPQHITLERLEFCKKIVPRLGDIGFASFPKSGSSWLSYILCYLIHRGNKPDEDFLNKHIIWPEASSYTLEEVNAIPNPRLFKMLMPYGEHIIGGMGSGIDLSPMKYIYIARNPKDVMVSYYEFEYGKPWSNYFGTWDQWFYRFTSGHVQRGDWFDHVFSWYNHRHLPNILFIWYEDLILRFHSTIDRIAKFLNYDNVNEEIIEQIYQGTKFNTMLTDADFITTSIRKKFEYKDAMGLFFRAGKIGSWKKRFTVEQNELFDKLFHQRMKGKDLPPITFEIDEEKQLQTNNKNTLDTKQ